MLIHRPSSIWRDSFLAKKWTAIFRGQGRFYHRKFKVLDGRVELTTPKALAQRKENEALERELKGKIDKVKLGGGSRAIERHTKLNEKLLVRDRLKKLLDEDYPFLELAQLAGHNLDYGDVPAAGSVMGIGSVSGQLCVITANDATVKAGTIYPIGVKKQLRAQEIALENNLPCIYLVDSGGGFLPLQSELFLPGGRVFYNEAVMSSLGIPQVNSLNILPKIDVRNTRSSTHSKQSNKAKQSNFYFLT